jgi:hypothetical protein
LPVRQVHGEQLGTQKPDAGSQVPLVQDAVKHDCLQRPSPGSQADPVGHEPVVQSGGAATQIDVAGSHAAPGPQSASLTQPGRHVNKSGLQKLPGAQPVCAHSAMAWLHWWVPVSQIQS